MAEGGIRSTPDAGRFMAPGEMQIKGGFLSKALFGQHKVDSMYKNLDKEKADAQKAKDDAAAHGQRQSNFNDMRNLKRAHDVADIHAKQQARNSYRTNPSTPTPTVAPTAPVNSAAQSEPEPAAPAEPANPAAKPPRAPRASKAPKPTVAEPVNPEAGNDAKPGASSPAPTPPATPKTTGMKSVFDLFGM